MSDSYEEKEEIWERMQERRKAKRGLYSDASEENSKERGGFYG